PHPRSLLCTYTPLFRSHRCHVKKAIVVSQPVAAAYNFTSRLLQKYSQDELSKLMILTLEGGWFTFDWTLAEGTKVNHPPSSVRIDRKSTRLNSSHVKIS